ncbi:MAG: hypothetical protein M3R25_11120, partial [Bacteroidota bacterium]|nr:hypothetical protein [Bacteroidota bacterium]
MNLKTDRFRPINGFYGEYGGAFIPELLYPNVQRLAADYEEMMSDDSFQKEFNSLLRQYVGRPTPLYFSEKLTNLYT